MQRIYFLYAGLLLCATLWIGLMQLKRRMLYAPHKLRTTDAPLVQTRRPLNKHFVKTLLGNDLLCTLTCAAATPDVVLTHGNFGNMYDYSAFFNTLPNLVLWDYRGYGESSGEPYESLNHWDLHSVIAAKCNQERFWLIGHSLGTNVTLAYLAAALRHGLPLPEVVVLVHPFLNLADVARHSTGSVLMQMVAFLVGDLDQSRTPLDYLSAKPGSQLYILYSEQDRITPALPVLRALEGTERVHLLNVGGEHHQVCSNKKIFNALKQVNRKWQQSLPKDHMIDLPKSQSAHSLRAIGVLPVNMAVIDAGQAVETASDVACGAGTTQCHVADQAPIQQELQSAEPITSLK